MNHAPKQNNLLSKIVKKYSLDTKSEKYAKNVKEISVSVQLFSSSLFLTSHSTCVHPGMEKAWKGTFVKRYLSLPT